MRSDRDHSNRADGKTRFAGTARFAGTTLTACLAFGLSLTLGACSDDDSDGDPTSPNVQTDFSSTLESFAENVAKATYEDLAGRAQDLLDAATALQATPADQSLLDAAAQRWVDTREPWESSEAFLFGPATFLSLDPALDSWPVDRQQLSNVLASDLELNSDTVAEGLGPALRGFHTIEFLLFREGDSRSVGDLTAREIDYLVAVCTVLRDDTDALFSAWEDEYAGQFQKAGLSGSPYVTQRDALLEIVEGMIGLCDEVANGKIADPFDEGNTDLVESQFSWNSLTDFSNNLRSVRNAYTGGYHLGSDGVGLDEYVRSQNEQIDDLVKSQIDDAITAIGQIPEPFRDNLDQNAVIEAAQQSIDKLVQTLETSVKPLIVS